MRELSMDLRSRPRRALFAAEATIDGYDVIDTQTGRPMGFLRATRREANGVAQSLNNAAAQSARALNRALRAT